VSILAVDGSSDNTGTSAIVHRPTAHATEATWRACLVSPLARQRLGHRRQRLRLPVRVGDRAGHGGGMLVLVCPATRSYTTFMRLATSCSSTLLRMETGAPPAGAQGSVQETDTRARNSNGVTRHGAPAAI
jgi:hypothetical protein